MSRKKPNFKEELKSILSEEELEKIKTAFDIVGDIAILELDEEFKDKEKEIGEALLRTHKNVVTVLNKASEHGGTFRTQNMSYLAGVDKRETLHKENNAIVNVDVENVYFSPRLSTERKRIMQEVKEGENILTMFSGSGPYPMVLSKNTKAKRIVGIEINPTGHRLAKKNKVQNKAFNTDFFNGDVNEIIPEVIKKPIIGLKANWRPEHLEAKIGKEKPELLEIYIGDNDLEEHYEEFYNTIKKLSEDMIIVLHAPHHYKGNEVCAFTDVEEIKETSKECYDLMEKVCTELNLHGFVAHPYTPNDLVVNHKHNGVEYKYNKEEGIKFFKENNYKYIFVENMTWGPFCKREDMIEIAKECNLKLCLDLAHLYNSTKNDKEFYGDIEELKPHIGYYHLVDAKFHNIKPEFAVKGHCFPIGEGKIDFNTIVPNAKYATAEVVSKDELNPVEMITGWKKLNELANNLQLFDRILMPLPKSAFNFLPAALKAAKKGTVIHLYDFLHVDDFQLVEEKAMNACKEAGFEYKKLSFNKCGQHSPRTYRVCLDFQVN